MSRFSLWSVNLVTIKEYETARQLYYGHLSLFFGVKKNAIWLEYSGTRFLSTEN